MRIIAGEARGRRLFSPPDFSIRPPLDSLRESLFAILEGTFEDRSVLDLFAGTGSFGLEAVSRGARRALFVDASPRAIAIIERNIETTGFASRCEVLRGNGLFVPSLEAASPPYALVFLDPPFDMFESPESTKRVFARVSEILAGQALEEGGTVVLRHPSDFRGDPPLPVTDRRRHGQSVVLRFTKGAKASP